ncbi:hypothetical protein COCOBI_pt-1450 (chloroplast) [Coccomyxa sp. Obi]|nr:hypothetical protein COCOBI_pt-1450 [Coccomyxa sp. Obi]
MAYDESKTLWTAIELQDMRGLIQNYLDKNPTFKKKGIGQEERVDMALSLMKSKENSKKRRIAGFFDSVLTVQVLAAETEISRASFVGDVISCLGDTTGFDREVVAPVPGVMTKAGFLNYATLQLARGKRDHYCFNYIHEQVTEVPKISKEFYSS